MAPGRITHLGQQAAWVWQEVPVPVIAAVHGHALGASGALEAVATIRGLEQQCVIPTANFQTPDPDCDVPLSLEHTPWPHEAALSNSFAFGGLNAVLVNGSGNVVATSTVSGTGAWSFAGIADGSYTVRLSRQADGVNQGEFPLAEVEGKHIAKFASP